MLFVPSVVENVFDFYNSSFVTGFKKASVIKDVIGREKLFGKKLRLGSLTRYHCYIQIAFATTLEQHNENVQRWFAIRRAKGDM